MPKANEVINVLLETAYKKLPEDVAARLYKPADDGSFTDEFVDNAADILLEWDRERVQSLLPPPVDTKKIFDSAYKEAEGKTFEKHEKRLRTEFPGVDPEGKLKGDDLVRAIKTHIAQKAQDPEAVKMSREYLELEDIRKKEVEDLRTEYESKIQQIETGYKRREEWEQNEKLIRAAFMDLNPVLSKDAMRASNQIGDFVAKFQGYQFEKVDDGRYLVKKDGVRVNDEHGNAMYLPNLVKQIGLLHHDFEKQPAAGNAGNTNDGRAAVTIKFRDEDDFYAKYQAETDDAKKEALARAWEVQLEQG